MFTSTKAEANELALTSALSQQCQVREREGGREREEVREGGRKKYLLYNLVTTLQQPSHMLVPTLSVYSVPGTRLVQPYKLILNRSSDNLSWEIKNEDLCF